MQQLPTLIPYEEIYDLDALQLEQIQTCIKTQTTDDIHWNKKAKKILDLIEVELKERQAIQHFAKNIQLQDFIQQPIYQNNALQTILNDIKSRPLNYLDQQYSKPPLPRYEQQKPNEQPQQSNQLYQQNYQKVSQQKPCQSDAMSLSTVTRSSNANPRLQSRKPNQMLEMMKEVLKKTEVSNQQFIIGAVIDHMYVPPPPKPQLSTVEKIKQEKLLRKKKKKKSKLDNIKPYNDHIPEIVNKQKNIAKPSTQQEIDGSKINSQTKNISKQQDDENLNQNEDLSKNNQKINQNHNKALISKKQISTNDQQLDLNDETLNTQQVEEQMYLRKQSNITIEQNYNFKNIKCQNNTEEQQNKLDSITQINDFGKSQNPNFISKNSSQERMIDQQFKLFHSNLFKFNNKSLSKTLIQFLMKKLHSRNKFLLAINQFQNKIQIQNIKIL